MRAVEGMSSNFFPVVDIIGELENILARSRVIIPDLETPHSRFPNTDQSGVFENQSISAILTERQLQLDAVSHEISGLETIMDGIKNLHQQLVEKKEKIMESMNLHKGLVSCLWRLPTEVLSQIFGHCLPGENNSALSPSRREAPMLLTGVCRRWREVAVDVPSLWCRLHLKVHKIDRQLETLCYDSWLKRSRGRPLSLGLCCSENDSTKLRNFLQPYINRLSTLSIFFNQGANKPEILLTNLPALQELTIGTFNHRTWSALEPSISQLSTLRSLTITHLRFDHAQLFSLNHICAHLTNVSIVMIQMSGILRLLRLCPNLSSLRLCGGFDGIQPLEPFTHTKIQSLHIGGAFVPIDDLHNLFNALSLPNLHVLRVGGGHGTWPHEAVKAFLARSNCRLESLIFGFGDMPTAKQRAEYVALVPSLEIRSS
ncbi:uncharacterized protein EDB91DRAFT_77805 [Suillus paluster]|uniref:uncharacterized protein n=1 Tax=Suillus paluster TaxID=48578 RepID=UPI001B86C335|nr:uncharacterized protein EDB91DRAFT_77805 [Suillus paluster]KAG1725994.1 hypothetical protein EDB91DRAFT_77805 [Suillus paluster]